ncbi:hypothetical protein [Halodesulfovibrio spirochaetisodalis]|uniref:hypothetical protein n=1 Tax=Halodesulfovibrio spirochaetisodalis TaxID=1560234 RepID=UPI000A5CBA88|nr:hypothetical protein [Halodesulfovibrio spirochaetisodalis]
MISRLSIVELRSTRTLSSIAEGGIDENGAGYIAEDTVGYWEMAKAVGLTLLPFKRSLQ